MAKIPVEVNGVGTVYVTKKRGQKTMRLRVDNKGQVQVSMPWMLPRTTALAFVKSKLEWIKQQQAGYLFRPYDGMLFGKTLKLKIVEYSKTSRIKHIGKEVTVPFRAAYNPNNQEQVEKIRKAVIKALRTDAERVLLPRLKEFAEMFGFSYNSAGVKRVVGRWGSCDSHRHISLSLYLIQLPIDFIDYVLVHELTHTRHMNHSASFWNEVEEHFPEYKTVRKKMRGLQPRIYDAKEFMA